MARIAPSTAFASIPADGLGQGDRINLGVASILGHRPEVAGALGAVKAALQSTGTLPPRLVELVRAAARPPVPRKPTKPTRASKRRRLEHKKKHGALKALRRTPPD